VGAADIIGLSAAATATVSAGLPHGLQAANQALTGNVKAAFPFPDKGRL
jgi:hypothetical protein